MNIQRIVTNLQNAPIRHETLHGRKYLVAPMAMFAAGVHNGSNGPLLYEEADIVRSVPAWNMKPIVVYHPTANNRGISAADKDVLERQQVGHVMNTSFSGGKLRAEAWIDKDLAAKVDNRVLVALEENKVMEVSTGLFTDNEATTGVWNGAGKDEQYTHIARHHQPDHLALLPDQTGAYSVEDGGGLLQTNAAAAGFEGAEVMRVARAIVGNKMTQSYGQIQEAARKALDERVPRKRKGHGDDSYTVGPWLLDVYETHLIFEVESKLYQLDYSLDKSGAVIISGDPVEVTRVTDYRPVNNTTSNKHTMKDIIVNQLIADNSSPWTEEDRAVLMALDETVLNKMAAQPKAGEEMGPDGKPKKKATENSAAPAAPTTADGYIAAAPPEIQELLRNGLQAHAEEQGRLIAEITGNASNQFTKEFLSTKGLAELRGLAALARNNASAAPQNRSVQMFTGAATPPGPVGNAAPKEAALPLPKMDFKGE